mmetsp:Transcript_28755/g.52136  ORF Transcript_28755/g.52136 Transcript_28755/m.52136 type:complete len:411 (+) Transcript_28755:281-1513(+)
MVSNGLLNRQDPSGLDAAQRILSAPNVFEVLLGDDDALEEKQVKSAYRKLALRVHPDKQADTADKKAFAAAFARLDTCKEALDRMLAEDLESCKELRRILKCEVTTRAGAALLLDVEKAPVSDTEDLVRDAGKASRLLVKKLEKMQVVAPDYSQAVAICEEAVKTLARVVTPESLPRMESLLKEGIPLSRALGVRDLRAPRPIVVMQPESAAWTVAAGSTVRFGLLCGSTAALGDETLLKAAASHERKPKVTALQWNASADSNAACSTAVCISVGPSKVETGPAAKKARTAQGQSGDTVRVRHILFRHQQVKQDPMARRDSARSVQEAEIAALTALETLLKTPGQFPRVCRDLTDCQSGEQPGNLCGDLGWLVKGQTEAVLDDAIFALAPNEFSDVLAGSRGIHIVQRLG